MKTSLLFLLFAIFRTALNAADTGLYELSEAFRPKNRLPDRIDRATLVSRSNDNTLYFLRLYRSSKFSVSHEKIGVVAGGKVIRIADRGIESGEYFVSAMVDDPETVKRVMQAFDPNVQPRRHPGYRMLATYKPEKAVFHLGDPVKVKMRIANVGDIDFAFIAGGRQRGARDNQFAFSVEQVGGKMLPDAGDPSVVSLK